jgi:membrane protein
LSGASYYVAHFSSYREVFGALGVVMLLLTWLYLTAFSVLLGAELKAEVRCQGRETLHG